MQPSEHFSDSLDSEDLLELQQRTNASGIIRGCLHFGFLFLSASGVVFAATGPWWLLISSILLCGLLTASMHAPLHEGTHMTAFRSRSGNHVLTWMAGFPMLMPPTFYRDFHFEHHRHTHDPNRDPEISAGGEKFAYWPVYLHEYLAMVSGLLLLLARMTGLLLLTLGSRGPWWDRWFSFIRPQNRTRAVWEARTYVAIMACLITVGIWILPGLFYLLFSLLIGFSALVIYLSSEHTGLPVTGSIFERTRTIHTNRLVRFFMWNMPYHAEHHAYPAVPFHQLPKLHDQLKNQLVHTAPGYFPLQFQVVRELKIIPRIQKPITERSDHRE